MDELDAIARETLIIVTFWLVALVTLFFGIALLAR